MAVLRIANCVYQPIQDRHLITVDCFYPEDFDKEDRTYLVIATSHDIDTREKMQEYIEHDINLQRTAAPNWVGEMWNTTRV